MRNFLFIIFIVIATVGYGQPEEHIENIHDNSVRSEMISRVWNEGFHDQLPVYSLNNRLSDKRKERESLVYKKGVIIDNNLVAYQFRGAFLANTNDIAIEGEEMALLQKDKVAAVQLAEEVFISVRQRDKRAYTMHFMKPIHQGELTLYALPVMKRKKGKAHPVLGTKYSEEKVVVEMKYYYAYATSEKLVKELPVSKSKFADIFKGQKVTMKDYLKARKTNPKKEVDVVEAFMAYENMSTNEK